MATKSYLDHTPIPELFYVIILAFVVSWLVLERIQAEKVGSFDLDCEESSIADFRALKSDC